MYVWVNQPGLRLRNDLCCVGWGVKLYSLTHSPTRPTQTTIALGSVNE